METAVLDALEEVGEDFGTPVQWGDGSWAIYCEPCGMWMAIFAQYRAHADNNPGHQRRSPVLLKKRRKAIARWEEHRRLLRRELGLEQ